MDSDPRSDVLHGRVQQVHTQSLETSRQAALATAPRWDHPPPTRLCAHRESTEQVGEHLSGQGALPLAHEGVQSPREDGGDPVHVQAAREPQLWTRTQGLNFTSMYTHKLPSVWREA